MNFFDSFSFSSFFVNNEEISFYLETLDLTTLSSLYFFSKLALNVLSYLYIGVKLYKVLCYGKMTCEWFPMINPYEWPFSFLQTLTTPYFRFWSKILPALKFQKSSLEISGIIALEALNALLYFSVRAVNILILFLDSMQTILNQSS